MLYSDSNSWQVYKRNANKLCAELNQAFPEAHIEVNPQKPRSKSFEVLLCKDDATGMSADINSNPVMSTAVAKKQELKTGVTNAESISNSPHEIPFGYLKQL